MKNPDKIGKAIDQELARVVLCSSSDEILGVNSQIQTLFSKAANYAEQLDMPNAAQRVEELQKQFLEQFGDFSTTNGNDSELFSDYELPDSVRLAIQQFDENLFLKDSNPLKEKIRAIIGPSFGGITVDLGVIGYSSNSELKESFCKESQELLGL